MSSKPTTSNLFTDEYNPSSSKVDETKNLDSESDKGGLGRIEIKRFYTKKDQNVEIIQMFMLASIPGINLKLAQELLSNFKSIANLVNAEIDELKTVPNIGSKLAVRIHKSLHGIGKEKLE